MTRLLKQAKRIFVSLRKLFASITGKATKGTGLAVKTVSNTVGFVLSIIMLIGIFAVIGVAAIPYGMFKKEVPADASSIVDVQMFCNECGQEITSTECDCKETKVENS